MHMKLCATTKYQRSSSSFYVYRNNKLLMSTEHSPHLGEYVHTYNSTKQLRSYLLINKTKVFMSSIELN